MLRGSWVDPRDADMAVADWVEEFLSLCRRLAERTQETYRRDLTRFVLPRFGTYRLGHIPASWSSAIAPILFAVDTGMRWSEIIGLRRQKLDLVNRKVRVTEQLVRLEDGRFIRRERKTAAGVRSISISPHIAEMVAEHIEKFTEAGKDALVFTGSLDGRRFPGLGDAGSGEHRRVDGVHRSSWPVVGHRC